MNKKLIETTWDKKSFAEFLVKKKHISEKVASNHVSRCMRIEKLLGLNLSKAVKDKASFTKLMLMVLDLSRQLYDSPTSQYAFAGTHRSAIRYFAEFLLGSQIVETYPRNHNLWR